MRTHTCQPGILKPLHKTSMMRQFASRSGRTKLSDLTNSGFRVLTNPLLVILVRSEVNCGSSDLCVSCVVPHIRQQVGQEEVHVHCGMQPPHSSSMQGKRPQHRSAGQAGRQHGEQGSPMWKNSNVEEGMMASSFLGAGQQQQWEVNSMRNTDDVSVPGSLLVHSPVVVSRQAQHSK